MSRRARRLLIGIPLAVLALIGIVLVVFLIRGGDEPPPPTLGSSGGGGGEAGSGVYEVRPGGESFVGYRVREEFVTFGVTNAVGRTAGVSGPVRIQGRRITRADLTADLTTLRSDESRRDNALRERGLESATFPEARFVLSAPVAVVPERGERGRATARGRLTLHGETRPVTAALAAQWSDDTLEVVGTARIGFADFGIDPPSVAGFVTVNDQGRLEFKLLVEPAAA